MRVLDHGYVRLFDSFGSDLSVVNAARVSYDKRSEKIDDSDRRLIRYLIKHHHTSPFRHAGVSFEIYAPLFVARQWWKYAVASSHVDDQNGWNESSRRYITEEPTFYLPSHNQWRTAPENTKQGSGRPVDPEVGRQYTQALAELTERSEELYHSALRDGIAPEQARLLLPAYGMYVRWVWTTSLQGVLHFVQQRLGDDSQWEIRQYAGAVDSYVYEAFPETHQIWVETYA
jgi:thymidylate synthase (FAD)